MPIYEYQCRSCDHQLEALQKISDDPLQQCPACGKVTLRKKVSAVAFRFKGGGWYETDFKTGDKKNIAGEQASTNGDSDASTSDTTSNSASTTKEAPAVNSSSSSSDSPGNSAAVG